MTSLEMYSYNHLPGAGSWEDNSLVNLHNQSNKLVIGIRSVRKTKPVVWVKPRSSWKPGPRNSSKENTSSSSNFIASYFHGQKPWAVKAKRWDLASAGRFGPPAYGEGVKWQQRQMVDASSYLVLTTLELKMLNCLHQSSLNIATIN